MGDGKDNEKVHRVQTIRRFEQGVDEQRWSIGGKTLNLTELSIGNRYIQLHELDRSKM